MKKFRYLCLLALLVLSPGSWAVDPQTPPSGQQYVRLNVDNLVIDTDGLVAVSKSLAQSIDQLAQSIERMSGSDTVLGATERESLLRAVASVEQASTALARLADELPRTTQQLGDSLPRMVNEAREPIAELSRGLQSAKDGVLALTRALPEATENAKALVNSTVDSILLRASIFIVVLFAALALATIGVIGYLYRSYFEPLAQKLDALVGAPEHFANLAEYMKQTSDNMIALQLIAAGRPGLELEQSTGSKAE